MSELSRIAKALYGALENNDPEAYISVYEEDDKVTIDGHFEFLKVAEELMRALDAPDENAVRVSVQPPYNDTDKPIDNPQSPA